LLISLLLMLSCRIGLNDALSAKARPYVRYQRMRIWKTGRCILTKFCTMVDISRENG